jgi:hypothetical protein
MGWETCTTCGGTGTILSMERRPSATGMFEQYQVSRACMGCRGQGGRQVADPVPRAPRRKNKTNLPSATAGVVTVGDDGQLTVEKTPEEQDKTFIGLVTFLILLYMGYLAFFQDLQAADWVKWVITLGPPVGVGWILTSYPGLTRKLRVTTYLLIAVAIVYFLVVA